MSRRTEHVEDGPPGRDVAGNGRGRADYRELVIDALAGDEAAQLDRIVDLSLERDQYQEYFKATLHALADVTRERNRYRRQYYALLEERRQGGGR